MDVMNYKFDRRKITDARIAKDLTQRELGELAKVSYVSIYRWESGERIPKVTNLADLANALDVPIDYFFVKENPKYRRKK